MTELVKSSTERSTDSAEYAANLLRHYSFDLGDDTIAQLLSHWQEHYPVNWIRLAAIEALYQGRYKAISVEQILALWQRRKQPLYHFNHEFERLVCDKLPQKLLLPEPSPSAVRLTSSAAESELSKLPYHSVVLQLPSFKATSALYDAEALLAIKALNGEALQGETMSGEPLSHAMHSGEVVVEQTDASTPAEDEQPLMPSPYNRLLEKQPSLAMDGSEAAQPPEGLLMQPPKLVQHDSSSAVTVSLHSDLEKGDGDDRNQQQQDTIAPTVKQPAIDAVLLSHPSVETSTPSNPPTKAQAVTPTNSLTRILQQVSDQALSAGSLLPSFGLMTYALKPKLSLHLTTRHQPLWLTGVASKHPIHQFTPEAEASDFHSKLKAVAQPLEQEANDSAASAD